MPSIFDHADAAVVVVVALVERAASSAARERTLPSTDRYLDAIIKVIL